MRSAPARSASVTCSPNRPKLAARMEGAILTVSFCILHASLFLIHSSMSLRASLLENVHKFLVAAGDFGDGSLARDLLRTPVDKRVPETGAAHGETDEALDPCRSRQPVAHLLVVLSAPQNDAADGIAFSAPRDGDNLFAVFAAVESFNLPHVSLNLFVLQFRDRLGHEPGPKFQIVGLLVAFEVIELGLFWWHQQFKHEFAAAVGVQVVGEPLQTFCLTPVECGIALGVIADQYLAEGWLDCLDVFGEVLAVLEVEFLLAAFLRWTSRRVIGGPSIAKNGSAKLLIDEDAGFPFWYASLECGLEAVVDHPLGDCDFRRLLRTERASPAKHLGLERASMIEGKDVQRFVEADGTHCDSLDLR